MWCNQIFAQINDNKIQNIIVCDNYEMANYLARCTYGENAIAVDTTLYPVGIGDLYEDGKFYRITNEETDERVEIIRNPTEAEQIEKIQYESDDLTLLVADMIGGV